MLRIYAIFALVFASVLASAQFTPPNLPGLVLWLSADNLVTTTGGAVSVWGDASVNNDSAIGASGTQPTLINAGPLMNNKPTIAFNGLTENVLSGVREIPGINSSSITAFIVNKGYPLTTPSELNNGGSAFFAINSVTLGLWFLKADGPSTLGGPGCYGEGTGLNDFQAGFMPPAGYPYCILEMQKLSVPQQIYLYQNGIQLPTNNDNTVSTFTNASYTIGYPPVPPGQYDYLNGEIAEIIIYEAALTPAQMQQVENYIYNKYAPAVSLGPDTVVTYSLCNSLKLDASNRFVNYAWYTGANGSSGSLISSGSSDQSIYVTQTGAYSVVATDVFGNTSTASINVTFPVINLNGPDNICLGNSITLVPQLPSLNYYTFLWNGGAVSDSITVNTAGNFYVTLTDTNNCSLTSNTVGVTIDNFKTTVSLSPTTSLCSGNTLALVSPPSSGWDTLSFHWSNDSTSEMITIQTGGTYSVTVADPRGCSANASTNVHITGAAPEVGFVKSPALCLGESYSPTDSASLTGITSIQWNFGDGAILAVDNPSHTYAATGTYNVTLSVVDVSGCSGTATNPVLINALPTASFYAVQACSGYPYQFTDMSIPPPGQSDTGWLWNFGDAGNSTSPDPAHTYTSTGNYTATLLVTAGNGCTNSVSNNVQVVSSAPQPGPDTLLAPVNGAALPPGAPVTFAWSPSMNAGSYTLIVSTDPAFQTSDSVYTGINSTQYTVMSLPVTEETYYWQLIALNVCGQADTSATDTFSIFIPTGLPALALWLKADSGVTTNGSSVSQWNDVSGSQPPNNAANAVSGTQPTLINAGPLMNNKPTLEFNALNNNILTGDSIPGINTSSLTTFIVNKGYPISGIDESQGGSAFFTINSVANGLWLIRADGPNAFGGYGCYGEGPTGINDFQNGFMSPAGYPYCLLGMQKLSGPGLIYLYQNGINLPTNNNNHSTVPAFSNAQYNIGYPPLGSIYDYLNGEIAEIIIYESALTPPQMQQVENYIYNKYAPPVNLGPDIVETYKICPETLNAGNRFVAYQWSTSAADTLSTVAARKTGYYSVSVVDVFGRPSTSYVHVTLPYHGTNFTDTTLCVGQTAQITQLLPSTAYSYTWYDSDSINPIAGATTNPITVSTAGAYWCVITDTFNCSFISDTVHINIDSFNITRLIPADTTLCANSALALNDSGYQIVSFLWSPGNDTAAYPLIPSTGTYSVTATDIYGCVSINHSNDTTRNAAPNDLFTVSNTCLGQPVQFNFLSSVASPDKIDSILWSFSGGSPVSTSDSSPAVIFSALGPHPVSLYVQTDSGCNARVATNIFINQPPGAGFTYAAPGSNTVGVLCAGSNSVFTDRSNDNGDTIIQRVWTFDNLADNVSVSDTVPGQTISYSFPVEGTYNITLQVSNDSGCSSSVSQQVNVYGSFIADFTYHGVCWSPGAQDTFIDLTQSLSIVKWLWNFGDGSGFIGQKATHSFSAPGTYSVSMEVENIIGCVSSDTQAVNIIQQPVAAFTGLSGCQDSYYQPLDSSYTINDTIVNWTWNIAGTMYSLDKSIGPSQFFADTGQFTVMLTVTTQEGCVADTSQSIQIMPNPLALFAYSPVFDTAPLPVTFTNNSRDAVSYQWYFGDGLSSTEPDPQYTYQHNGTYNILLIAYSNFGCADSVVKTLIIEPTMLCISMDAVIANQNPQPGGNTLITVVAEISNFGTRLITSAQFYVTLNGTGVTEQSWTGLLPPGASFYDTIPTQFVLPEGSTGNYVCIQAENLNNGQAESNCASNLACATLTGTLQLVGPAPNPAMTQSTLGIIMPQKGMVTIDIIDGIGRAVFNEVTMNLPAGITDYNIPVGQMNGAEYFIRVTFNGDVQIKKFVVR